MVRLPLVLLGFVLLAGLTLLMQERIPAWKAVGDSLLVNPGVVSEAGGWRQTGGNGRVVPVGPGTVVLENDDPLSSVALQQDLPLYPAGTRLLLQADVRAEGISPGQRSWQRGRVTLLQLDGDGQLLRGDHQLAGVDGDTAWKSYSRMFQVTPQAERLVVRLRLARVTGRLWVRRISMHRAGENPGYRLAQTACFSLWGAWLLFLLMGWWGNLQVGGRRLVALGLVPVLAGTLVPADLRRQLLGGLREVRAALLPGAVMPEQMRRVIKELYSVGLDPSSMGHLLLFALLAGFLVLCNRRLDLNRLLIELMLIAAATELSQFFVPGRGPQLLDWLIDLLGILVGMLIAYCLKRSYRRRQLTRAR